MAKQHYFKVFIPQGNFEQHFTQLNAIDAPDIDDAPDLPDAHDAFAETNSPN